MKIVYDLLGFTSLCHPIFKGSVASSPADWSHSGQQGFSAVALVREEFIGRHSLRVAAQKTHSLVSGLVATTDLEEKKSQESSDCQETFARDIEELMRVMVDEAVQSVGIPMPLAQKDDKMRVVKRLDENGVFLVKGAVDYVAHILGISRYTVYNYLDETRVAKYTEGAL